MKMKHNLIKRGDVFYVRAVIDGKVVQRALRDEHGNSIKDKRDAIEAKKVFMEPLASSDRVKAIKSLASLLSDEETKLAAIEDQKNPPLTLAQAWSMFLGSPNRPDSGEETLYQYECQWSAFAEWMKEKHPDLLSLRSVTKEIVEEYAGTLNHGRFSPNTYNKHLNLLTLVFRVVKHKAKLTENPWEDIQRKRLVTHSRRELTIDELKKVCQSAAGELKILLAVGVYSGLRLGDCATLRWGEVDVRRGIITRIPNKTGRRNPKPVIVPVHPVLRDMLNEAPVESRAEYVLPEMAALYLNRIDLVTDKVQAHLKACGIKLHKPGTGKEGKRAILEVGFHSLRHTFVSLCRESNAPLSVVESIVGHSSPAMTRHYTHVGELAAGRAIAALPSISGEQTQDRPSDPSTLLGKLHGIVKEIGSKNWKAKKEEILALLAA